MLPALITVTEEACWERHCCSEDMNKGPRLQSPSPICLPICGQLDLVDKSAFFPGEQKEKGKAYRPEVKEGPSQQIIMTGYGRR